MKKIFLVLPLIFACAPSKAQMNPYQIGMQYCQMVNSGMSRDRAWNYVLQTYSNTSPYGLNQGDPYAPWSPTKTWGGAIGSGIASGLMLGMQLRGMKPDIERVVQNNCPAGYAGESTDKSLTPEALDPSSSSYCTWSPWLKGCKDGSLKVTQDRSNCLRALQKYDCKYTKYLEANPHMQTWVDSNPEMARKEALRLKAVDVDEIGAKAKQVEIVPPQAESLDPAETCLKAADYKGCMEYNNAN